jgi:hypothetical protein
MVRSVPNGDDYEVQVIGQRDCPGDLEWPVFAVLIEPPPLVNSTPKRTRLIPDLCAAVMSEFSRIGVSVERISIGVENNRLNTKVRQIVSIAPGRANIAEDQSLAVLRRAFWTPVFRIAQVSSRPKPVQ